MDEELKEKFDEVVAAPGKTRYFVKKAATLVVGYCVASTVRVALRSVSPDPDSKTDKVKLEIGAYGVGGVVAAAAQDTISEEVDDLFDSIEKFRERWNKSDKPSTPEPETVTPSE